MEGWSLLYIPFEALGRFLRLLSLRGGMGNAAAWGLYVFLGLLPIFLGIFWLKKKREGWTYPELFLLLLSAYSFYLLYLFINPHLFYGETAEAGMRILGQEEELLPVLKSLASGLWYLLLAGYVLLRLLLMLRQEEALEKRVDLYRGLSCLLLCSLALYGLTAVSGGVWSLIQGIRGLEGNEAAGALDTLFVGLKFLLSLLPRICFLGILWQGRVLLGELKGDPFGAGTIEAARRLSRRAVRLVQVSVYCALAWNGSLFLFRTRLAQVNYGVQLSLFPLLLAFGALILARYAERAGELRQENELFI